jgi:glycosyltransferase involved in cell wall biosynthesis
VVALGRGGALETVVPGETGVLFDEPTVDALAAALERVPKTHFDSDRIRRHALQFSRARHLDALRAVIEDTLDAPAAARW